VCRLSSKRRGTLSASAFWYALNLSATFRAPLTRLTTCSYQTMSYSGCYDVDVLFGSLDANQSHPQLGSCSSLTQGMLQTNANTSLCSSISHRTDTLYGHQTSAHSPSTLCSLGGCGSACQPLRLYYVPSLPFIAHQFECWDSLGTPPEPFFSPCLTDGYYERVHFRPLDAVYNIPDACIGVCIHLSNTA
jgi:hypothetical protein